jgi:hypothetical protein
MSVTKHYKRAIERMNECPGEWEMLCHSKNKHSANSYASQLRHGSNKGMDPEIYGFRTFKFHDGCFGVCAQKLEW